MTVTYNDMQKLSEIELLSLTLQESPNSQVIQGLLSKINTIEDLLQITMQELKVEGIKPKPANQFLSTIELTKRIYASPSRVKEPMNSPENVADFLMPQMRYLDREVFIASSVTSKLIDAGNVLGIIVIDHIIIGDARFVSMKQSGNMS